MLGGENNLLMNDSFEQDVYNELSVIADMLISKNKKYGNSALKPMRVFSKMNTLEQINVRIDDKLSRIANRKNDEDEDPELDLIGYLILRRIKKSQEI
jgi:hypothetical protein